MVLATALALTGASVRAQGVELDKFANVVCGYANNCTRPATIDYTSVRESTPEWQTIRDDGVRQGSARHTLLLARMNQRIKAAAERVASAAGHDLVVRQGDIADARGQTVVDITGQVKAELDSAPDVP